MNINWTGLWLKMFGTTEWLGINMGFWVSMIVCVIIVIGMNVVFWSMKPLPRKSPFELEEEPVDKKAEL